MLDPESAIGYKVFMKSEAIKKLLKEKRIKVSDIARELGVAQPTVTLTIQGKTTSARIRTAIAEAIGKPVEAIWPPKKAA